MNCKNVGPIVEDESKATLRELAGPSSKTTTSWTAAYARNAPMAQTCGGGQFRRGRSIGSRKMIPRRMAPTMAR